MEDKIGVLKTNSLANFIITSDELFKDKTIITENWIQGKPHILVNDNIINVDGDYDFLINNELFKLNLKGSDKKLIAKVTKDSTTFSTKSKYSNGWLDITIIDKNKNTFAQFNSKINDKSTLNGNGIDFQGDSFVWTAKSIKSDSMSKVDSKKIKNKNFYKPVAITYPNNAYGNKYLPKQKDILFKALTVWTNEKEGIIKNTDVLVVRCC